MPPEPVPWERREFVFRERKHERGPPYSDTVGGGGSSSGPRWREPYHGPRDFHAPSPRRPLSGYGRHGSGVGCFHQLLPDEQGGHGCTPSRSEDEGFRSYPGRYGGGGGGRNGHGREGRGSFRRSSWDFSDPPRQHRDLVASAQRSVDDPLLHPSSHLPLKDHHDKTGGGVDDGSRTGPGYDDREVQDRDRDHSLGSIAWRPLKWTRSGSFSSSSKASKSELDEGRTEESLPSGMETPVRSPVASPVSLEEGCQKKKPRLGWGQGLAKYEKAKVEGPEDCALKNGLVQCSNNTKAVSDVSPKLTALAGSTSPATPSSVACSSSRGMDDKPYDKGTNDDARYNASNSPGHGCRNSLEDFSINSEHLELNSLNDIDALIAGLLQPEDVSCADSNFTRQTAMNKLLLLKGDVLKVLEKTESEIDMFENELKKLNSECERSNVCQNLSKLQADILSKPSGQAAKVASNMSITSTLLEGCLLDSAAASSVREPLLPGTLENAHEEAKEHDIDSPYTVTSKFGKTSSMEKGLPDTGIGKVGGEYLADFEANSSAVPYGSPFIPAVNVDRHRPVGADGNDLDLGSSVQINSILRSHDTEHCSLTAMIMASNRDSARKASEAFDKMLPDDSSLFDVWSSSSLLLCKRKDLHVKEKLAMCKGFLRFKERVLTLKFRAFQHLWKEDMRLLSMRKHRPKSQKRFELNCRSSQNGSQKHRSSIRSRFALPGNLTLVPTTEIVEFTSKLLSDSQIKLYRNNLKMPALILDERDRRHTRFLSKNGSIEDPCSFEKERAMINPWMPEEKEVFMELLITFGKDFSKIASFLSHKTTADCIEFYYKNHKSESFKEVKKSLDLRKQWQCLPTNNYLVTSGKKWKHEMNAASLDMLGAVSIIAAQANDNMGVQQKFVGKSSFKTHDDPLMSFRGHAVYERANSVEVLGHERETTAAGVLVGICGGLSSEAVTSCITTSADPGDQMNRLTMNRSLVAEVTQNVDEEDTCSDEGCGELDSVDWTDEEKSIFIQALSSYGRDFTKISHCVGTRSREQCKIFFSKARKCLGLDVFYQEPGNGETPTSDANGGRSDTDDACVVEMDSAICSTQSCCKMEVEFTQSAVNTKGEGSAEEGNLAFLAHPEKSGGHNELGGSTQVSVETNVEKPALISNNNDKMTTRKEKGSQLEVIQSETINVASRCNGSAVLNEAVALFRDAEANEPRNNPAASPSGSVATAGLAVSPSGSVAAAGLRRAEQLSSHDPAEPPQENACRVCDDGFKAELEPQKLLVPETGLDDRQWPKACSDADKAINSHGFSPEPNAEGSANHFENKVSFCPSVILAASYRHRQHQRQLDLPCLHKKPQMISWKQKESSTCVSVKMLPDPQSIHFEDPHQAASHSTLNFEEHGNKLHQSPVSRDIYQQYFLGNQSLNRADQPVHILRGFPRRLLNKKDMNGDLGPTGERAVLLQNLPKKSENNQSNQFMQDTHSEKCNGPPHSHLDSGHSFLPKSNEQSDTQLRSSSQGSRTEMEEQSVRTGDVKLFGQILSHPSPVQKSSSPQESNNTFPSPKSSKIVSSKLSTDQIDRTPLSSRPESSCHRGLEELPLRSYGFWDGNRIQTGFSSMPESAMFLAKYPGALGGLSCYPAKDSSVSNGVLAEYQQAYLQSFLLDGKRHGIFCDLQKHNGFETVSGFQNQGRVSVTRVAGGGILVGSGNRTGVSDPVTAIKMHYAGRSGVLSNSEEDSWRGDIGGR